VFVCIASAIQSKHFSYKLVYYLFVGGFSTLGEELGWRGFLQGALQPVGRMRGYLLLALMWEVWHFTSHTKGAWDEVISRLAIIVPAIVVITFALAFLTERTGSVVLATAVHEWIDLAVDPGGHFLWAGLAAVPVRLWITWTWPKRNSEPIPHSTAVPRLELSGYSRAADRSRSYALRMPTFALDRRMFRLAFTIAAAVIAVLRFRASAAGMFTDIV
jgi:hypothetical protein